MGISVTATLSFEGFEVLVPKVEVFSSGAIAKIPLHFNLQVPPGTLSPSCQGTSRQETDVTILAAVIDPDYQEEPGLQLHSGSKEEDVFGTQTVQLAVSLSYPCSILIVNREVQQPRTEQDMATRRSAEVLPEGEKHLKWMVEEEDDNSWGLKTSCSGGKCGSSY